jgi:PAS domain S-box-containing protein
MNRKFKALILEHDANDIELLQYELKKHFPNHESKAVQNENHYVEALTGYMPDIILSDFSLPSFDGVSAYHIKQEQLPNTPFILVSGTIGEEKAVELIKDGVTDYVLKDKLYSLPSKVIRALNEKEERIKKEQAEAARLKSEANLRSIFENTNTGFYLLDASANIVAFNKTVNGFIKQILDIQLQEGLNLLTLFPPDYKQEYTELFNQAMQGKHIYRETHYPHVDGTNAYYSINGSPVLNETAQAVGVCISINDITRKKEAENEIKELNEQLEQRVIERTRELLQTNKELKSFTSTVSHDLRTPLRSIGSFTSLIRKKYAGEFNEDCAELFGLVETSVQKMSQLIDDLLAYSRAGKISLQRNAVDIVDMAQAITHEILQSHQPAAHEVSFGAACNVLCDGTLMRQVLQNLIGNAIKYSAKKEKPAITFDWYEKDDEIVFYVKDNGAGFDMQYHDKLFTVFQRLHTESEFEGTGVGLAIVERILSKHGGRIWAEAKVNEGATFYFSLPKT